MELLIITDRAEPTFETSFTIPLHAMWPFSKLLFNKTSSDNERTKYLFDRH